MAHILLTGFEPFGTATSNPSEQLARQLSAEGLLQTTISHAILPVEARRAPEMLSELLLAERPDWCVMLGLAAGRAAISIERVALNLCDFRIPDNAGDQLVDQPVVGGGPDAYFSTLPVRSMLDACLSAGAPTELSLSAGAYLCNQISYHALHLCATRSLPTRTGFIHLPATPELAASMPGSAPSLSLDTMATGLRAALAVLVGHAAV
jgi:pyroglutamyl-peptidase